MNTLLANLWQGLVRLGFRVLYREMAFTYDWVSWIFSLGQWRSWQMSLTTYLPASGRVLELAHGTGHLQRWLHENNYDTIGIDLSPQMGQITRQRLLDGGFVPQLLRGDGAALPFPASHFEALVCTFPTAFIYQQATLDEIARVLVPGGIGLLVLNGELLGKGPLAQLVEWAYRVTGQRGEPDFDIQSLFVHQTLDVQVRMVPAPGNTVVTLVELRRVGHR